ncbi:EamA family transporter [Rhizobium bangladeshense]|uniref:EamA family transporter n=1 Tax=Rhizobium bangladeshense TaxID=1138189 RepID=UPI001C83CE4D|nr:EamA family transporter [Rhizobium bangladeshense]MBX4896196.1 EamA family transporter [Rhizobium bangladeshense]MBX4903188.1 EamA family transporter [Rhizobium bangladeshense]MBY3613329.1 EamA family transporter [Rhizobium bangladeshense]
MKTNARYLADVLTTAVAPAIWGSTYFVTTSFLPQGYPLTVALLRALPAGLLLLLIVRKLPTGVWWGRAFILGALNFSFFWAMLFVSAYRLPGGVAATVGAVQPLIVIALSRVFLGKPIQPLAVVAGFVGMIGVGLLVLTPKAALDSIGVAGGLAGAVSMAFGTVLARRWAPPVSNLTFTAWQLTAGGILLVPFALLLEPALPMPTAANLAGIAYLGLIGAAFTYLLWFRGLSRIEPSAISSLGFLSPVVATLLGWLALSQSLTPVQIAGFAMVLAGVWLSQRTMMQLRPIRPAASPEPANRPV